MFNGKSIMIIGGTGEAGRYITRFLLNSYNPNRIIIFSRNEHYQNDLADEFSKDNPVMRYFIGDIRDYSRLLRAMNNVDYIINCAQLGEIDSCEYNPNEAVKTNIMGTMNIIEAAIAARVKKVVTLSSNEAVFPVTMYGATKMVSDKLLTAANVYATGDGPFFSVIRFGSTVESFKSDVYKLKELSKKIAKNDCVEISNSKLTRFWLSLDQICKLVVRAIEASEGGEIFVPKAYSYRVVDLISALGMNYNISSIGLFMNEQESEVLIPQHEASITFEFDDYYVVNHRFYDSNQQDWRDKMAGAQVEPNFKYDSYINTRWLSVNDIIRKITDEQ